MTSRGIRMFTPIPRSTVYNQSSVRGIPVPADTPETHLARGYLEVADVFSS
jgi:hypothetical protein